MYDFHGALKSSDCGAFRDPYFSIDPSTPDAQDY
jgi:hypothetical protein